MRHLTSRHKLATGAVALLVVGVVGLVYAAWTTNGTGSGYAKATSASPLTTVDVSATTPATLYPGADGNVLVRINNPNTFPVRVTAISGNGAITAAGGTGTCTTTGVTFTNQSGLTLDIPASSAATSTLTAAAHMSNASDDGCQGATFTIPVSLIGASNAP
jgi:hypothetical protein